MLFELKMKSRKKKSARWTQLQHSVKPYVSSTPRQDWNAALECFPAQSAILFSSSYRSILEAQPRSRRVGSAVWGTSTQPPTPGHGFWVKLSASDGSSQLSHLLKLLTALFPCKAAVLYHFHLLLLWTGVKFKTRVCSTLQGPAGDGLWDWLYVSIEMPLYFSGVFLPEAGAWPWYLWLGPLRSEH